MKPAWMTNGLLAEARAAMDDGLSIRDIAADLVLTYHKARELCREAVQCEATTDEWSTTVVFGDVHIPFHDPSSVDLVYRFIEDIQPDRVVINGDLLDCYKVSHFSKAPTRGEELHTEIALGRAYLETLREIAPGAEIVLICGNHEHRLHRYICDNAAALYGLEGLSIPDQLHLDQLDITWVDCPADRFVDTYIRIGGLLIGHFDTYRTNSGYTARYLLDKYGLSLVQGHVHSFGSSNKTLADGAVMAWESGCLCDLAPHYCVPTKWMHGFVVIHHDPAGERFHVQPVLIMDDGFFYGGRHWRRDPDYDKE